MTKFAPPTSGGSYVQQKSGKAKLAEKPTQNAPADKPAPSENSTKAQEA